MSDRSARSPSTGGSTSRTTPGRIGRPRADHRPAPGRPPRGSWRDDRRRRATREHGAGISREVAHLDSLPLRQIVGEILTSSDDFAAETLLRDLAIGPGGDAAATTGRGAGIVVDEMARLGVITDGLVLHDGSGLSPDDRARCSTLLQVIEMAARPKFAAVDGGLAVAARTGTLADRFGGGPLGGKAAGQDGFARRGRRAGGRHRRRRPALFVSRERRVLAGRGRNSRPRWRAPSRPLPICGARPNLVPAP